MKRLRKIFLILLVCLSLIFGVISCAKPTMPPEEEQPKPEPPVPPEEAAIEPQPKVELFQNTLRFFRSKGAMAVYPDCLIGEVQNVGNAPAGNIKVTVTSYDDRGYIVAQKVTSPVWKPLLPGEKSPFVFWYHNFGSHYTLDVSWDSSTDVPSRGEGFKILNFEISKDDYYGWWEPKGEVLNVSDKEDSVSFFLTFYDKQGRVLIYTSTMTGPLIPNQVTRFGFSLDPGNFGLSNDFEFSHYSLMIR